MVGRAVDLGGRSRVLVVTTRADRDLGIGAGRACQERNILVAERIFDIVDRVLRVRFAFPAIVVISRKQALGDIFR